MEDNKNINAEEIEPWIITLTDDETGEDQDFEVIAEGTVDGKNYFALVEANVETDEYSILEYREDGDDIGKTHLNAGNGHQGRDLCLHHENGQSNGREQRQKGQFFRFHGVSPPF